jgi:hypothetical protein
LTYHALDPLEKNKNLGHFWCILDISSWLWVSLCFTVSTQPTFKLGESKRKKAVMMRHLVISPGEHVLNHPTSMGTDDIPCSPAMAAQAGPSN